MRARENRLLPLVFNSTIITSRENEGLDTIVAGHYDEPGRRRGQL